MLTMLPKKIQWAVFAAIVVFVVTVAASLAALFVGHIY